MRTILLSLLILSSCSIEHKAKGKVDTSGKVEASGKAEVEITYKQCDRPDWTYEQIIECLKLASQFTVDGAMSPEAAKSLAEMIKQKQGE